MNEFAIIAITYNRPLSLDRLLTSLTKAEYLGDKVDLIISIDYSDNDSCSLIANNFEWKYGEKIIINHKQNLGLRKHVLSCGDFTNDYENICVFEDDIYASPAFYNFAKQATKFYKDDENIAGISLYNHQWNYIADKPFVNVKEGYDIYFMQQAQSWGQVWNKRQWNEFNTWYSINEHKLLNSINFPDNIANWPKSSWLKYHMKFLVEKNKFFIYPNTSYSTNFSDVGTHASSTSTKFQTDLEVMINTKLRLPIFSKVKFKYDIYFEYLSKEQNTTFDLYYQKKQHDRYLVTLKKHHFKLLHSYGLNLRPHELNVIYKTEGADIYVYDTSITERNTVDKSIVEENKYYCKYIGRYDLMNILINLYTDSFFKRLVNYLKKHILHV